MPLLIDVPSGEYYDEEKNEFVNVKGITLKLEHSLIAISKWEAKYHRTFLKETKKMPEQMLYYIQCMTITQNVDPIIYNFLSERNYKDITAYIENPMSATNIPNLALKTGGHQMDKDDLTSEMIYYIMVAAGIPFKCETWHLNRLLKLIEIYDLKNQDPEKNKVSRNEILARNRQLNDERRRRLGTKG